mgnify:CR=1 FL=1
MNEQQRKFKIEILKNYEEEIQRLYFQVNRSGMFTFLGVGMAVAIFAIDGEFSHSEVMDNFVGIISAASAVTNATIGTKRYAQFTEALIDANVDLIVLDSAHGHSQNIINSIAKVKEAFPDCQLIAGNVATGEATRDLINAGADNSIASFSQYVYDKI